jgi:hypothetical protein
MTTLPEGACFPVIFIDVLNLSVSQQLHHTRVTGFCTGRHQYIGMNSDVVSLACITQAIQQEPIIVFFEEAWVSITATLNNMTGYARQIHPWFSWHRNFLFLYKYRFLSIYDIFIIRKYPKLQQHRNLSPSPQSRSSNLSITIATSNQKFPSRLSMVVKKFHSLFSATTSIYLSNLT